MAELRERVGGKEDDHDQLQGVASPLGLAELPQASVDFKLSINAPEFVPLNPKTGEDPLQPATARFQYGS